jgi:hypothetical protein
MAPPSTLPLELLEALASAPEVKPSRSVVMLHAIKPASAIANT